MQFLSDIFIRCPECNGRRYREHILEVKLRSGTQNWSIADMLDATIDDALTFLMNFINVPAGRRALARLKLLQDVGLGYLRLGQPINTLSGGESQRLKLSAIWRRLPLLIPQRARRLTLLRRTRLPK